MLKGFISGGKKPSNTIERTIEEAGLIYKPMGPLSQTEAEDWIQRSEEFREWELVLYLQQLVYEGLVPPLETSVLIPWNELYEILDDADHQVSIDLLDLPIMAALRPHLDSRGSLSDEAFEVVLSWRDEKGRPFIASRPRIGGVVFWESGSRLLPFPLWQLNEEVKEFSLRTDRSLLSNETGWGNLRKVAKQANAYLDEFLTKTIILTVDKLDLDMRKVDIDGRLVVELQPDINGLSKDKWLSTFDGYSQVQEHYDLALDHGERVRVIPDKAVSSVLKEIKRMPGRRVSGKRAKAFLRNPYAVLGEAMTQVITPEKFELLQQEAGIVYYGFDISAVRNERGRILSVSLIINPEDESEPLPSPMIFETRTQLSELAKSLKNGIEQELPCIEWEGYELEVRGDTPEKLRKITGMLTDLWVDEKPLINAEEILDLERYAERIIGIDVYKPIYSPHFKKKDEGAGWLPENIEPIMSWIPPGDSKPVHMKVDMDELEELAQKFDLAEREGKSVVELPNWPHPIDVSNAKDIINTFKPLLNKDSAGLDSTDKSKSQEGGGQKEWGAERPEKLTLLIAENIIETDYAEERGKVLAFDENTPPELPQALQANIELKEHQKQGIAWLQNLYKFVPDVHGCVLADDMGLGKTLQLLTLIHWHFEQEKDAEPVLIVAPVSLLDNWHNEIAKFFNPDALKTLLLYGKRLAKAKVHRREIDDSLVEKGITRLMRPDWLGDAQIVLTTYETLRDLEFSFGATRWSIMICDEAQKIKTPNAMVTRAAKKQNVKFRIACTGTPVENTLTDLWCLFDFVQPGLLGALNEFSHTYRRPIETVTDEQNESVERLRKLIEPQVLRRMKHDVADLPPKIIDDRCRELGISQKQVSMYLAAVEKYKQTREQREKGKGNAAFLSMLHSLRMICADPTDPALHAVSAKSLKSYQKTSPKMSWLINQLRDIQKRKEKVIVFTEFRDIQRLIQHYIQQVFNINVCIVNGDTSAQASASTVNRQGIIDAFQAKKGFNVIILSTTAIGFGVNIQAANHVVHFTRPWNPAKEDQATDRAYRIGQEREVSVYYPTITADNFVTFEQKLDVLLESKRRLAGDMLNGYDDLNMYDWEGLSKPDGGSIFEDEPFTSDMLRSVKPKAFEKLCEVLWAKQGYSTYLTPASGDNGVDVVAIKGETGFLIQCKTSGNSRKALGWDAIKEVVGGCAYFGEQHPSVTFVKVAATNVKFNKQAKVHAELNKVELFEFSRLSVLLEQYVVRLGDIG